MLFLSLIPFWTIRSLKLKDYLKYKKGGCIIIIVFIVFIIIIVVIHKALVPCFLMIFSPDMVLGFEAWGLLNLESKRSHPLVILFPLITDEHLQPPWNSLAGVSLLWSVTEDRGWGVNKHNRSKKITWGKDMSALRSNIAQIASVFSSMQEAWD